MSRHVKCNLDVLHHLKDKFLNRLSSTVVPCGVQMWRSQHWRQPALVLIRDNMGQLKFRPLWTSGGPSLLQLWAVTYSKQSPGCNKALWVQ